VSEHGVQIAGPTCECAATQCVTFASSTLLSKTIPEKLAAPIPAALPTRVDLRQWCSPIENQGSLGACTANAAAGIVEYFERRAFGQFTGASRLFVYKTTRELLGWVGDTGAGIRNTMGALALFGVPPEKFWPYTDVTQPGPGGARTFDEEPPAFVYELAEHWEAATSTQLRSAVTALRHPQRSPGHRVWRYPLGLDARVVGDTRKQEGLGVFSPV
jgi:C1A family cysteine protease